MKRFASKELSGALILIFTILFIQTLVFLFSPAENRRDNFEERSESANEETEAKYRTNEVLKTDSDKYPKRQTANAYTDTNLAGKQDKTINLQNRKKPVYALFDPNTVTLGELTGMGMSPGQASLVIKYRERGGVFKTKEDFKKIYSVSDEFYMRVKNYISIDSSHNKTNLHTDDKSGSAYLKSVEESEPDSTSRMYGSLRYNDKKPQFILELNSADSVDLLKLRGIGPYYASKIIRYRENLGGFISVNQLTEISGIDSARYSMFCENLIVDSSKVIKRDISSASFTQLASNPYIGSYLARTIIRYTEANQGRSVTTTELFLKNIIRRELYNILCLYFR